MIILIFISFTFSFFSKSNCQYVNENLLNHVSSIVCKNPSQYGFVKRSCSNVYYTVTDLAMDWFSAENYCQSLGGHLATSRNLDDDKYIQSVLNDKWYNISNLNHGFFWKEWSSQNSGYWIGAFRSVLTNTWTLVDGSQVFFTKWTNGQPDNFKKSQNVIIDNFAFSSKSYIGWNDISPFSYNFHVICELKC
ncbi:unnamed protein product [Brachionus calyciflorus]|uniref:C-type lectin domain-containing protein n=1 Tax=Brachionus calyciflorus TaxID=104777 RepID=A0A814R740_9BILA|nr:unnamed protein product [Brachionus calyciflorus]